MEIGRLTAGGVREKSLFFSVSHHFKSSPINVQTSRHKKSSQSRKKKCVSSFFFFNVNFLNAVLLVHVADRYIIRRGLLF